MQVPFLPVPRDGHAGSEEGDVPQEGEAHGEATVGAEDLHGRERRDNADPERNHIGQRRDRDGHGSLGHCLGHPSVDPPFGRGPSPSGQHDECVVDADTCAWEWGNGEMEERYLIIIIDDLSRCNSACRLAHSHL